MSRQRIKNHYRGSPKFKQDQVALLLKRDGPTCHWCGEVTNPNLPGNHPLRTTRDHLVKVAEGGSNEIENIVLACFHCNTTRL